MRRVLIALGLVAGLATLGVTAAPAHADAYYWHHHRHYSYYHAPHHYYGHHYSYNYPRYYR